MYDRIKVAIPPPSRSLILNAGCGLNLANAQPTLSVNQLLQAGASDPRLLFFCQFRKLAN